MNFKIKNPLKLSGKIAMKKKLLDFSNNNYANLYYFFKLTKK